MPNFTEKILINVNARKMGQQTLGTMYRVDSDAEELRQLLIQAEAKSYQDGYWDIYSCRRVIGPIIVFLKKVTRKAIKILFGWYIFPIYKKQSDFNELLITIIRKQQDTLLFMQGHIELLEKNNNCQNLEEL